MEHRYYKLPLNIEALLFNGEGTGMPTCSEEESIDRHIELILTTCPGEHKFNKSFGCRIWEMDFEIVVSRKKWEEDFTLYIREAVECFERRIRNTEVSIHVMEVTREDHITQSTAVKKKVIVHVRGQLVSTGQTCGFRYKLFLGPLATE